MNIIPNKDVKFRFIERKDLDEVFILLNQLTKIDYSNRNVDKCWEDFNSNTSSNSIVGIYKNKIIAYGSIVIENKIRGEKSGHIEDIVVDKNIRGNNIGVNLIRELVKIGKNHNCYRISLCCDESLIGFYSKNGFTPNDITMKKYL